MPRPLLSSNASVIVKDEGAFSLDNRICLRCQNNKSLESFALDGRYGTGLKPWCKECQDKPHHSIPTKRIRRKDQPSHPHRYYYYKIRYAVLKYYSHTDSPSCECCGLTHLAFLAIDHIHGGGTQHSKSIGGQSLTKWLWANDMPDGYRVLCHNCNHAYGHYGKCPHKVDLILWEETPQNTP